MKIRNLASAAAVLGLLLIASPARTMAAEPEGVLPSGELKALVMSAKTPADHLKLAGHYHAVAAKHEAEAKEHEALAVEYGQHPAGSHEMKHPMSGKTAEHCKFYAGHCRKAAKEMHAMAAAHEEMAKSVK